MAENTVLEEVSRSLDGERPVMSRMDRTARRSFRALPLKVRSLLRLLYRYGASERDVAGALGISRGLLRRMVQDATDRATDPLQLAILSAWNDLEPDERRLAYLHRFLGLSLREIARLGLVAGLPRDGRADGKAGLSRLRKQMRGIERKARRAARRHKPESE